MSYSFEVRPDPPIILFTAPEGVRMAYSVTKLLDAPVVVFKRDPGDNPMPDMLEVITAITQLLDQQLSPVFLIFDIRGMLLDLDDMLGAARISARGRSSCLHHHNIRENVYVTEQPLMKMGIKALASATYGCVRLSCFDTLEEAQAYCNQKLGLPVAIS